MNDREMDLVSKSMELRNSVPKRLFRHIPPTGVAITKTDFLAALSTFVDANGQLETFKDHLSELFQTPNVFVTSSGRSALTIILLSLKELSNKTQVLLPAYSCPTVVWSVLEAGLEPRFCDVSPFDLNFDRAFLSNINFDNFLAVVPTHLYGLAQDFHYLVELCQSNGVFFVEDAAQAFGASVDEEFIGLQGDVGFFSLGRGKSIPVGNGGIILAKDGIADQLGNTYKNFQFSGNGSGLSVISRILAYRLATSPFGWWFVARSQFNPAITALDDENYQPIHHSRFHPTQAAIGLSMISRIDTINGIRRNNAEYLSQILSNIEYLHIPDLPDKSDSVFIRFPVIANTNSRAELILELLTRSGIGASRSYRRTLPGIFSNELATDECEFPGAIKLAECLLTLPTHHSLNTDDFERITQILELIQKGL